MARPAPAAAPLYTPQILSLATQLANYPLVREWERRGEARAPVCGSRLRLGVALEDGAIRRLGMMVEACAIGQAAAAIFAERAGGLRLADLVEASDTLAAWLDGGDDAPAWPQIELLDPARAYPARHGAIMLPWKAAIAALSPDEMPS